MAGRGLPGSTARTLLQLHELDTFTILKEGDGVSTLLRDVHELLPTLAVVSPQHDADAFRKP